MSLTCPQPFIHRHLRGVMWVCEGHFRLPWFFASESLENRNHLRFASATGGRPFRFLLAPRPHVAEEASASFGQRARLLRATSLKPSDSPSNTCLSYLSERNFEYSWSISNYSDSIGQRCCPPLTYLNFLTSKHLNLLNIQTISEKYSNYKKIGFSNVVQYSWSNRKYSKSIQNFFRSTNSSRRIS